MLWEDENKTIIGLKLTYPSHTIVECIDENKTIIGLKSDIVVGIISHTTR